VLSYQYYYDPLPRPGNGRPAGAQNLAADAARRLRFFQTMAHFSGVFYYNIGKVRIMS
jgi:hypothetical protein